MRGEILRAIQLFDVPFFLRTGGSNSRYDGGCKSFFHQDESSTSVYFDRSNLAKMTLIHVLSISKDTVSSIFIRATQPRAQWPLTRHIPNLFVSILVSARAFHWECQSDLTR